MEKFKCLECEHCFLLNASPDWSEVTPGHPMEWTCSAGHYTLDPYKVEEQLESILEKGRTCPDFKQMKVKVVEKQIETPIKLNLSLTMKQGSHLGYTFWIDKEKSASFEPTGHPVGRILVKRVD